MLRSLWWGGGLISPARADWVLDNANSVPVKISAPAANATVFAGNTQSQSSGSTSGSGTAVASFVWNGVAPPGPVGSYAFVTVTHQMSVDGPLQPDIGPSPTNASAMARAIINASAGDSNTNGYQQGGGEYAKMVDANGNPSYYGGVNTIPAISVTQTAAPINGDGTHVTCTIRLAASVGNTAQASSNTANGVAQRNATATAGVTQAQTTSMSAR